MRLMAPDGKIGDIPEENVQAAIQAGAKLVSDFDLSVIHTNQSLAHKFFEKEWKLRKKKHQPFKLR